MLLSDGSFSLALSPHQYSLVDVSVVAVVYLFFLLLDGHTHTFATNSLSLRQARACNKRERFNPLLSPLFFSFSSLSPSPSSSPQRAITLTYLLLLDSLPFFFSLSLSLTSQAFRDRRTAQIIRSLSARVLLHISSLFVLFRRVREREETSLMSLIEQEFIKVNCFGVSVELLNQRDGERGNYSTDGIEYQAHVKRKETTFGREL